MHACFLYLAAWDDSISSRTNHGSESKAAPPLRLGADGMLHHIDGSNLQDGRDTPRVCEVGVQELF